MTIQRREFFKHLMAAGALLQTLPGCASRGETWEATRLPVLQGATTETSTQIIVLAVDEVSFQIPDVKSFSTTVASRPFSPWKAHRLILQGLDIGQTYQLDIRSSDGELIDRRSFATLDSSKARPRIALASCMRDTRSEHQSAMWAALAASSPDLLILLGDNVYVDDGESGEGETTEEKIWSRYVETRVNIDLYHMPKLIPTIATWDDHDFGHNNTWGQTSWSLISRKVFRELYGQDAVVPEITWGPGIATSYRAFGQIFYLLDNRSFRGGRWNGHTHWGSEQENWLFENLQINNSPSWLLNGSQFFGGYRMGWSYEGSQPGSFKKTLARLRKIGTPVVFASGDVHYSEVMRITKEELGFETVEITSSSMHSNAKDPQKGNKRRIASSGEFNFVVVDVDRRDTGIQLGIRSLTKDSRELFRLDDVSVGTR